jgi:hypothetical protein
VWARARELSGASRALLAFTLLSAVAAVVSSHNPDLLLYKDAMATGLIGVIFAGSLLSSSAGVLLRAAVRHRGHARRDRGVVPDVAVPGLPPAQYAVTTAWAVVYLIEAAALAYVIHSNGFTAAYPATQVLPWTATGVAVALTIALARHYRRAV